MTGVTEGVSARRISASLKKIFQKVNNVDKKEIENVHLVFKDHRDLTVSKQI